MNEREELLDLIETMRPSDPHAMPGGRWPEALANQIFAAGYRKRRVITTSRELESVPYGTVVRSEMGTIAARFEPTKGVIFGDDRPFPWAAIALPAVVLYDPTTAGN